MIQDLQGIAPLYVHFAVRRRIQFFFIINVSKTDGSFDSFRSVFTCYFFVVSNDDYVACIVNTRGDTNGNYDQFVFNGRDDDGRGRFLVSKRSCTNDSLQGVRAGFRRVDRFVELVAIKYVTIYACVNGLDVFRVSFNISFVSPLTSRTNVEECGR